MNKQLTPRQVARAMGVSEASLKRWCDRELIPSVRTAGGHRRLELGAVLQFLRESGRPLPAPEVLGLPSAVGKGPQVMANVAREATEALVAGDEERMRSLVISLFLSNHAVAEIGDEIIARAFADLGDRWQHGTLAVYEERRACEIVTRLLHELWRALPRRGDDAPLAVGGTLAGDPYTVANTLVEVALRDARWRTVNLGCGLPAATVAAALTDLRPQLLWLSLTSSPAAEEAVAGAPELTSAARMAGTRIVLGGRAVDESLLERMPGAIRVDGLRDLVARQMPPGSVAMSIEPAPI
jgi:MerR family transcriptional regulator, light-induced transcriptional regulator